MMEMVGCVSQGRRAGKERREHGEKQKLTPFRVRRAARKGKRTPALLDPRSHYFISSPSSATQMSLSSPASSHHLRPPRRLATMLAANQSYSCDTIPPARIAELSSRSPSRSPSPHPSTSTTFDIPAVTAEGEPEEDEARERWGASVQEQEQEQEASTSSPPLQPSQGRKLCIRHQRMADEGMNLQLQKVCSCQHRVGFRFL